MAKAFFEVFPGLKLESKLKSLFEQTCIERVTATKQKDFVRIYLTSDRLIQKEDIFTVFGNFTGNDLVGQGGNTGIIPAFISEPGNFGKDASADIVDKGMDSSHETSSYQTHRLVMTCKKTNKFRINHTYYSGSLLRMQGKTAFFFIFYISCNKSVKIGPVCR